MAIGEGPSGRFSMAGESLDPQMGGVLVFIGGCNKNLEALDDMHYLHTGFIFPILETCRLSLLTELEHKLTTLPCSVDCPLPGLSREIERDERRNEKLSLRKQLKLKCQEQRTVTPVYENAPFGVEQEHDTTIYQPMPISSYMPSGKKTSYVIS